MKIGIPVQSYNDVMGVKEDYLHFVEEFGTPYIIYPWTFEQEIYKLDGLVLPGGTDVNPKRYQPVVPAWMCYPPDHALEHFDVSILPKLISKDFPIFGICRGLQTLNVHFGGMLWRDLPRHPYSKFKGDLVHEISFLNKYGKDGSVNSFHHQCIWTLGKGLEIVAKSADNVIEAIRHTEFPIWAVQWHPERLPRDAWSRNKMKELFQ